MAQNTENSLYLKPALLSLEVDDKGKDFASAINEASFRINLTPADELVSLFERHNFSRRGKFTWSRHMTGETVGDFVRFVEEYSESFTPYTLFAHEKKAFENNINAWFYRTGYRDVTGGYSQSALYNLAGNINGVPSDLMNFINRLAPAFMNTREYGTQNAQGMVKIKKEYDALGQDYRSTGRLSFSESILEAPEEARREFSPARLFLYVKRDTLYVTMKAVGNIVGYNPDSWDRSSGFYELCQILEKKINAPAPRTYVTENYHSRWVIQEIVDIFSKKIFTDNVWDMESSAHAFSMLAKADDMVTVGYAPGKPAQAIVVRGKNVRKLTRSTLPANVPTDTSVVKLLKVQEKNSDVDFAIHPSLMDIVDMSNAKKYNEPRLHEYQKVAVGLHLSTAIGYLNASDPGLGKSMMLLTAMRKRAENQEFYRGLIVSEANVRHQWKEYAHEWFPEAETFILTNASQSNRLMEALSTTKPLIVITSYALAAHALSHHELEEQKMEDFMSMNSTQKKEFFSNITEEESNVGEMLYNSHWHDICADEAVCIRNGASKQAKAMWLLREHSDVAVALTGTPVNKGADDMAKLLEWVRNDKRLFQGHKLSQEYDTESLKGATELFEDLSPLIFRRERNEVKNETDSKGDSQKMPSMKEPVSILLKPTSSEKALAYAAENELKRVYLELIAALDAVDSEENAEALKEAKEQLRDAHGQWLGGTQLARMATSDPASLLKSDSVGASLLVGQGLVANAMEDEPTKRAEFIKRAQKHIKKGQSVLVFTDFTTVADSLVEALEENGIRAGAFTGKNITRREQSRKDFQDGNLDVLVCTKAAERGLTLHKASAIYHYDMPWTVERLIQRIGRALRVGSENHEVEIFFMLLEGTVEERVAAQVLSQGTSASMILDASRGVDVAKTGLGSTMAGLMSTSTSLASRKGALEFGKALNLV